MAERQSWGHEVPQGPQLHHLSSPGYPNTKWEPRGKEALHSSRRPEHRRQPRCRVGVVGCHWRKQRAPGWGRSTLPGCGQERRPQGPTTRSKQREKEKTVKTGGEHCRSPPKDTPRPMSHHSVPVQSGNQEHLPAIGLLAREARWRQERFLLSSDPTEGRLLRVISCGTQAS